MRSVNDDNADTNRNPNEEYVYHPRGCASLKSLFPFDVQVYLYIL